MFNAHLPHIEKVGDVVFSRKVPSLAALFGGLDILVGHKVVQYQRDAVFVKNRAGPAFFKFVDSYRAGDIVAQHHIQLCLDELAGFYLVQACMGSQNFLCHCHSHVEILLRSFSSF